MHSPPRERWGRVRRKIPVGVSEKLTEGTLVLTLIPCLYPWDSCCVGFLNSVSLKVKIHINNAQFTTYQSALKCLRILNEVNYFSFTDTCKNMAALHQTPLVHMVIPDADHS